MENPEVARVLAEIGELLRLQGGNPYKVRAYLEAARTIRGLDERLDDLAREGRLRELPAFLTPARGFSTMEVVGRPESSLVVLFAVLLLSAACAHRPESRATDSPATVDGKEAWLQAHMKDGSVYVLSRWEEDADEPAVVRGTGSLLGPDRTAMRQGELVVPVDSVALFETNVVETSPAVAALAVVSGVTAGVTAACIANPKACFGSCPTFWVTDGEVDRLQAEGFSASIAPALEATDVDLLLHAVPTGRTLTVTMTNEALETHVVRGVRLLAARRPPGGRVFMARDGSFHEAVDPVPPTRCRAAEGSCTRVLAAADGAERFVPVDSTDLAAREEIELVFTDPPAGPLGLVLVSRQSLLSTFLLYHALAAMGSEATRALAALGREGSGARERAGAIGRELGEIEVSVRLRDGGWRSAGVAGETGPLAADTRLVPLPPLAPGPVTIRLRLTRGHWRLDHAALVTLGDEAEAVAIEATEVRRDGVGDPRARALLNDGGDPLVTRPGDAYAVVFTLPEDPAGHEYFLESTGYYLEWMRTEWLAEEDPAHAARLFLDPAGALRNLAPVYSRMEPDIERIFWASRYADDR